MVQAQRTSSNLTKLTSTELARCVGCFCTRSGWLKHIEPQRTYTLLTITELARCVGCFCTRAGWFKHVEPPRTYTNHTITERARCVGCFSLSGGGRGHGAFSGGGKEEEGHGSMTRPLTKTGNDPQGCQGMYFSNN